MSDEPTILGSDEEDETPAPKRENSTIRQMREQLEAREAALKAAEERAAKYESTFLAGSGLTEKQSAALKAAGYEATPDGINAFRSEVLGAAVEATTEQPAEAEEAEEEDTDSTPDASFTPTITSGSTPAGKREVTSADILELVQTDPRKAEKLLREGRVVRKTFNPGGPAF